jgi:hypothetical protein
MDPKEGAAKTGKESKATTEQKQRLIELCAGAIELAHTGKRDAEMVDFLLNALQVFKDGGGILFTGPPNCGKTQAIKTLADEMCERAGISATLAILEKFKAHILSPEERRAHFHYYRIAERFRDLPDKYEASKVANAISDDIWRASHETLPTIVLVDFTEVYPEDTFAYFKMKCERDGGCVRIHIKNALDALPERIKVFVVFGSPSARAFSRW